MRGRVLAIAAAILFHVVIVLFGGLLFMKDPGRDRKTAEVREVDLFADEDEPEEEKKKEPEPEAADPRRETEEVLEVRDEPPPDTRALLDLQDPIAPPALQALSLGALESLLDPAVPGGGGFGGAASLASGGRIGGTGGPESAGGEAPAEAIFNIADLDQRPRAILMNPPVYPAEMRRRRVEGTVYVLFVVDPEGRVVNPKVEKSTHTSFEKPALDAVRQWRFEPGTRNGEKVTARMRVPIRFSATG
jgi:protein TonB